MIRKVVGTLAVLALVGACQQTIPKEALQLSTTSLEDRQQSTRWFSTDDEAKILRASSNVLQDLGFTLDESESKLGLVSASKDRDATEAGQIAGAVLFALLTGAVLHVDENQKIRASVVTSRLREGKDDKGVSVRVTFQRIVWNTAKQVTKVERLNDPKEYQQFFEKLSKAVFLDAQEI